MASLSLGGHMLIGVPINVYFNIAGWSNHPHGLWEGGRNGRRWLPDKIRTCKYECRVHQMMNATYHKYADS